MSGQRGRNVRRGGEDQGVETYTLREAAAVTGMSQEALRKRVDRGTVRSVKRDGTRRIPRSELERAGLRVGEPAAVGDVVRELTETIRRQEQELTALRALPERIEEARRDFEREAEVRAEEARAAVQAEVETRLVVEERAAGAERAEAKARAWREQLTQAGWRERRRMLREARAA